MKVKKLNPFDSIALSNNTNINLIRHFLHHLFEAFNKNFWRSACNTKWNIEILEARNGIGGKYLPKIHVSL